MLRLGEAYVHGWWECDKLDECINKVLMAKLDQKNISWRTMLDILKSKWSNQQSIPKSFSNVQKHYDIGNDLYEHFLDKRMIYSCAYWKNASTLDEAQENKLDLVCKKLELKPGMTLLDIGCGWGGFLKYAVEKYQVKGVGITLSEEQCRKATKECADYPIEIWIQDYRDVHKTFDRIASIGMFEHVGQKNYKHFMQVAHRSLKDDGLFLLHTIGENKSVHFIDPWIQKYIFPNAMLPSLKHIGEAIEELFVMEDWHNFGSDYDKTLMAWFQNFDQHWEKLKQKYGERFYRMWKYYLLTSEGAFRARSLQVWQVLLSKGARSRESYYR